MNKGMTIIEASETETKCFYIDQDALEFARLNARTKKHVDDAARTQSEAERCRSKAEKAKAQRKAYTLDTLAYVLTRLAVIGAVTWAMTAGMIHPAIFIPVSLYSLCTACLRLGEWAGRNGRGRMQYEENR